jgi:MFS family permease
MASMAASARAGARARAYRVYVLALLVTVGIVGWVDRNVFAMLLESIKTDLVLSDTEMGLLGGVAFGVFYAGVGLPLGWLADRHSRSSLIAAALALWSLMTAACGLAGGFTSLFFARVGVGIGEAGGSPPSQSLIADYFPPEQRARAFGVLYLYIPCGFVAGYLCGGWLDALVGWQLAFLIVGLPGVALAVVVRLTLLEPPRGHADGAYDTGPVPDLAATLRYLLGRPALRHLPLAGAIHGIGAFAAAIWLPAYFMRTFEVTSATAGAWMAIAFGCGGGVGVLCGGQIADAIVRRTGDARWYAWGCAGVLLATLPWTFLLYLTEQPLVAVGSLIAATLLGHMFLGPVAAMLQNLAGVRRRATVAALYLFLVNLVSMGLGPVAVGFVSDRLGARFPDGGLRYALLGIVATTTVLAAAHFLRAAHTLRRDLALAGATVAHVDA